MPLSVPTGGNLGDSMAVGQFDYDMTGAATVVTGENYDFTSAFVGFDNIGVTINVDDTLSFPTGVYQFETMIRNNDLRRNQVAPVVADIQQALNITLAANGSTSLYTNNPKTNPFADIQSPIALTDVISLVIATFIIDYKAGDRVQPSMTIDETNIPVSPTRMSMRIIKLS